jgi:hypothetical protein
MKTKKTNFPGLLIFILIISCQSPALKISEPSLAETEHIKAIGDAVSEQLTNSLQKELKAAIAEGGFQNAIEVCNLKAIPLTELVKKNQNIKLEIKRTSSNYRNPLNAPDSIEKLALDHFIELFNNNKEISEYFIQKITENQVSWFCYYKPIRVGQLCLGCHGQTQNIDSTIVNQLAKLYPYDKAVGYSEGDFRGLISVTIRE